MNETVKNFLALLFSTIVWVSGMLIPASIFFAMVEWEVLYLLFLPIAIGITGSGIWIGKHNERVRAALEYPFGFFG